MSLAEFAAALTDLEAEKRTRSALGKSTGFSQSGEVTQGRSGSADATPRAARKPETAVEKQVRLLNTRIKEMARQWKRNGKRQRCDTCGAAGHDTEECDRDDRRESGRNRSGSGSSKSARWTNNKEAEPEQRCRHCSRKAHSEGAACSTRGTRGRCRIGSTEARWL